MRKNKTEPISRSSLPRGEWLSLTKASKKIGLGRAWFYRHMAKGTLPFPWFFLSQAKRAFDSVDLDDWLQKRRVPAGKMHGDV